MKTGGYEAEYGQSSGGVVNVVTKSGTNTLRGSLFGYFRPEGLESAYDQVQTTNGTVNITGTREDDSAARPAARSCRTSVFFFGAIDPQSNPHRLHRAGRVPAAQSSDRCRRIGASRRTQRRARGRWRRPASRRVVLRRSGARRHRAAALHGAAESGHVRLQHARQYGGHNQTVRYEGRDQQALAVEGSFARAANNIVEMPSVDQWSVTDNTVTPQQPSGGIGFYEVGNHSTNWQYGAKATNVIGAPSGPLRPRSPSTSTTSTRSTGPGRRSRCQTARRRQPARRSSILPDPTFGQIYRVVRANTQQRARHDTALRRALRAGHLDSRVPPDDQSRAPLRAPAPDRHAGGPDARQRLGAADRRHLGSDRQGQDEGLRQLGLVLHAACRTTSRRARCRPTPA